MARYIVIRILSIIPTLIGVAVIVFLLVRLLPGTVVNEILGAQYNVTQAQIDSLRHYFGLDIPIYQQFYNWVHQLASGSLGTSWRTGVPVSQLIFSALPVTLELMAVSMILAICIGLALGILAAVHRSGPLDGLIRVVSLFGLSIPDFWQGTLIIVILSVVFHWLPPVNYVPLLTNPLTNFQIIIFPSLALATVLSGNLTRIVRSAMLDVLHQDFVRTARAKGLTGYGVIVRHGLRNALIPILTITGLQVGYLLGGAVLVEQVFSLPGMGRLLLWAIYGRDYPLVQGTVLVMATFFILVNLIVDLLYLVVDPRVRLGTG
jgi:peptide/nickel transport system permease protein